MVITCITMSYKLGRNAIKTRFVAICMALLQVFVANRMARISSSFGVANDGHSSPLENPAENNLLEGLCSGLGKNTTKLDYQDFPCRYERSSIHADLLISHYVSLSNTYIRLSTYFLPLLPLQKMAKVHLLWNDYFSVVDYERDTFIRIL